MDITILLLGIIIGATTGFIFTKLWKDQSIVKSTAAYDMVFVEKNAEVTVLQSKLEEGKSAIELMALELKNERMANGGYIRELSAAEANLRNAYDKLDEQEISWKKSNQLLLEQFENLSSRVLNNNAQHFNEQSSHKLSLVLNPLKEKIEKFEQTVEKNYDQHMRENISLKEQIKILAELNKQVSNDALNLTNALKGDKKVQGNWGEMLLEALLEKSGLEKGSQYTLQTSLKREDGSIARPDVIIRLPDNKHLIIDSKVSLKDYTDYCSCEDDRVRKVKLAAHIHCLKDHWDSLGIKRYDELYEINSPDFVLMFIPIEPAFTTVMQHDSNLFLSALEKNVVLVTSSTLLATLRTVSSIWKQENQKRNVLEIAEESGKLYDKFVGFLADFESIELQLKKSSDAYTSAKNKLTEGSGNVVTRFEKLKKLGAKASKNINQSFLDASNYT